MEKISLPVRIFAVVIVLVGVAGMLAMRTMSPSAEASAPIPQPVQRPAAPAKNAARAREGRCRPQAVACKAAKPKPPVNPVVPPSGFPVVVDRALRQHEVVVVSLVVPGARVDELAAAEAEAGAKLGGAGFLALNVLNEGVARALLAKLDSVQDPSVLVVKRSGEVAVELTGLRRPRDGRPGRRERLAVSSVAKADERELFVRHARKDGRSVAVLRAIDHGDSCVVETEVYPAGAATAPTRSAQARTTSRTPRRRRSSSPRRSRR